MFRLEIKSDKRNNSAGKRNNVINHVKYINREGRYKNVDMEEQKRWLEELPNTIVGQQSVIPLPENERIIYSSPFGIIKVNKDGLHLSEKASPETIAIALSLSQYLYKGKIEIAGTEEFKQKVLSVTTIFQYNNTTFNNADLQEMITQLRKDEENGRRQWEIERRRFLSSSGSRSNGVNGRSRNAGGWKRTQDGTSRFIARNNQSYPSEDSFRTSPARGLSVPTLSTLPVVPERYRYGSGTSGTVQRWTFPGMRGVLDRRSKAYGIMRWSIPAKRRIEVERVTKTLITQFQKSANEEFSQSHVKYINRDEAFKYRGGCLYTSHHLPKWADDSSVKFFEAADAYERKNAEHYKEIILSLPNELSLDQYKEIVEKFIAHNLNDYYYTYAIHDKIGSLSNGERQPHVHIMFSTRKIDDTEKKNERPPEIFFSRSNDKEPEKGGCKKDRERWTGKYRYAFLADIREDAAKIINEALEKNGIKATVSYKSLKAQAAEAKAEGNWYLAELLSRMPQQHIDTMDILSGKDTSIKKVRNYIYNYTQSVYEKNIFMDITNHEKIEKEISEADSSLKELMSELNNTDLSETERNYYLALQESIDQIQKDIFIQQQIPLWGADIIEKSLTDLMNTRERENWQQVRTLGRQKKNWEKLKNELLLQEEPDDDVINVLTALDEHLKSINQSLTEKAIISKRTFKRLSQDSKKEAAKINASKILFENEFCKKRLMSTVDSYKKDVEKLIQFKDSVNRNKNKTEEQIFTTAEVIEEASRNIFQIKKDIAAAKGKQKYLEKKIIFPPRAIVMAKNIYTKNQFKEIRSNLRKVQKEIAVESDEQTKNELMKQYNKLRLNLENLEKRCSSEKAKRKINLIAAGIMLKNQPVVKEFNSANKHIGELYKELEKANKISETIKTKAKPDAKYKLPASSGQNKSSAPAKLAAALNGDINWAILIAENKKDNRFGNWVFLSEMEKDELSKETTEK